MPFEHLRAAEPLNIAVIAERRLIATSDLFFRRFIMAWLPLGVLLWILQAVLTPSVQYPGQIMVFTGAIAAGLMRLGRPVAARWFFVLPLCALLLVLPAFISGVRTPVLLNMPLIVLLAAWLLGRRVSTVVATVFAFSVVAYWSVEVLGWYTPPIMSRSATVWVLLLPFDLAVTSVTLWALLSGYAAQLHKEIALQKQLDKALSEARLAFDGLDTVPSQVFIKDRQGCYLYANPAECAMLGRSLSEIRGRHFGEFFDLTHGDLLSENDRRVIEGGERLEVEELVVLAHTGESRHQLVVKSPLFGAQGQIIGLFGISYDITEKKRNEEALRAANEAKDAANAQLASVLRFNEAVLLNSPLPMAVYAADGQCVQVNEAYADFTGLPRVTLEAQNFHQVPAFNASGLLDSCLQALQDGQPYRHEAHAVTSAGKVLYCEYRVLPTQLNGKPHLLIQLIDLSERKRREEELRQLAFHDALTHLPNRRLLLDRLLHALQLRKRSDLQLAVLFLDLNRFKLLNDTHGHDAGDLLLIEVARRLRLQVRESDTVARLGGDEFVVLLEMPGIAPMQAEEHAKGMAEKIRTALSKEYVLGEIRHQGSASIGVKLVGAEDQDPDLILKDADVMMYEFKRQQR